MKATHNSSGLILAATAALVVCAVCSCRTQSPHGSALITLPGTETIKLVSISVASYWSQQVEPDGSGHIGHRLNRGGAGAEAKLAPGTLSVTNILASLEPHLTPIALTNALSLDIYGPRPDMVHIRSEVPGQVPSMHFYGLDTNHTQSTRLLFDRAANTVPTNQTRFHEFYFESESPWTDDKPTGGEVQ